MLKKRSRGIKMFLCILPFMALVFIFSYYPLYGWVYAFFDYRPPISLANSRFVGLYWFESMFSSKTKIRMLVGVLKNTFVMSGIGILTSWLPMAFAIFLSEISSPRYKKVVQTLTTLPHFVSWVLVYFIAFSLFSASGVVNNQLMTLGLTDRPIQFLQFNDHVYLKMWFWNTWKDLGWNAIMYLAAISSIDQELYEAAKADGAGRFRLIRHITIPGLLPTYFVLLLLSIANFLNNGMEQYFLFQNSFNKEHIQVLDLYVYNLGMTNGSYSLATAFSIFKSLVSLILLFTVNGLSKSLRGETII